MATAIVLYYTPLIVSPHTQEVEMLKVKVSQLLHHIAIRFTLSPSG